MSPKLQIKIFNSRKFILSIIVTIHLLIHISTRRFFIDCRISNETFDEYLRNFTIFHPQQNEKHSLNLKLFSKLPSLDSLPIETNDSGASKLGEPANQYDELGLGDDSFEEAEYFDQIENKRLDEFLMNEQTKMNKSTALLPRNQITDEDARNKRQEYQNWRSHSTGNSNYQDIVQWTQKSSSLDNVNNKNNKYNNGSFCPPYISPSSLEAKRSHNRIRVDSKSGERTFSAKIVAMFSCFELTSSGTEVIFDHRLAKPSIDLALAVAKQRYKGIDFEVTYTSSSDACKHDYAAGHAAEEYYERGANYFVGPACTESLGSVAQLVSYWNVPICSTGYLPQAYSSRYKPLTLIQLALNVQLIGEMIVEFFRMYKWKHLTIVTDARHPLHSLIRDALLETFNLMNSKTVSNTGPHPSEKHQRQSNSQSVSIGDIQQQQQQQYQKSQQQHNQTQQQRQQHQQSQQQHNQQQQQRQRNMMPKINVTSRDFNYTSYSNVDYNQIILDAASYSRIMLLLAGSQSVLELLMAAHNQGMSNGQFVFIALELFEAQQFDGDSGQSKYSFSDRIDASIHQTGNTDQDRLFKEIIQPLFIISLKIPTSSDFDSFRQEVATLSEREFNYKLQSNLRSLYALAVAGCVYDCILLYADKVNHILMNTNLTDIDGKTFFDLAVNTTFTGGLTGNLAINSGGQRVMDFTLNDFSVHSMSMEPLAHYFASERELHLIKGRQPFWARLNQSAPRSDPRCRLNESLYCRYDFDDLGSDLFQAKLRESNERFIFGVWLLIILVAVVILCSTIIGWFIYRRFRIESELLNLWWSIKYEDIIFEDEVDIMCDSKRSMSSLAISNESFNEQQHQQQHQQQLTPQQGASANTRSGTVSNQHLTSLIVSSGSGAVDSVSDIIHQQKLTTTVSNNSATAIEILTTLPSDTNLVPLSNCRSVSNHDCTGVGNAPTGASSSNQSMANSTISIKNCADTMSGGGGCGGSACATSPLYIPTMGGCGGRDSSSTGRTKSSGTATLSALHQTTTNSNLTVAQSKCISNSTNKLLPLISKSTCSTGSHKSGGGGSGISQGREKSSGFSLQLTGGGSSKNRIGTATSGNNKDPSISSQNKVKLRLGTVLNGGRDQSQTTKVGLYKASRVAVKHLNIKNLSINRQLLIELRQVRDLTHENLIKFIGLCPEDPNIAIVSELCIRGNLQDLLQNESIRLDWPFRYSIINDIVDGLIHLHSSPIQYHGRLKSSNCVIDNRFVVKLTDFGLPTLISSVEVEENINPRVLLWTAPEHLRTKHPMSSGSSKGDIYSLAIIFQEIITRCGPFECEPILCTQDVVVAPKSMPVIRTTTSTGQQNLGGNYQHVNYTTNLSSQQNLVTSTGCIGMNQSSSLKPMVIQHKQRLEPEEIVNLVRMGLSPPFRPYFRPDLQSNQAGANGDFMVGDLIALVQNCWQENASLRPTVTSVKQQIKKMRRGMDGANIMDNLLQRMERYTDNLESLVEQKTAELMEEKKRSEELLYEMLPRFVVDQLKYGHSVTPEAYEAVTISFSDIKDFTKIAAQSSPIEVVNLLNQLYTEFDDCIARYDVYKVETIGDAYMVVSGLPIRNGDNHAREIAEMSLSLLDTIRNFEVIHLPHVKLELRIGVHSGPCASGVVGTRMYRYCLFGDTVNTASRMESHGEPMKIHISEDSALILQKFNIFQMELRGEVEIKSKGMMNTYWLTGRKGAQHNAKRSRD